MLLQEYIYYYPIKLIHLCIFIIWCSFNSDDSSEVIVRLKVYISRVRKVFNVCFQYSLAAYCNEIFYHVQNTLYIIYRQYSTIPYIYYNRSTLKIYGIKMINNLNQIYASIYYFNHHCPLYPVYQYYMVYQVDLNQYLVI